MATAPAVLEAVLLLWWVIGIGPKPDSYLRPKTVQHGRVSPNKTIKLLNGVWDEINSTKSLYTFFFYIQDAMATFEIFNLQILIVLFFFKHYSGCDACRL